MEAKKFKGYTITETGESVDVEYGVGKSTYNTRRMDKMIITSPDGRQIGPVASMAEAKREINRDIDALVELKREIIGVIKAVDNPEYQTLLEKRYLCFLHWEQIAVDMNYGIDNIFKLHKKALACVVVPEGVQ